MNVGTVHVAFQPGVPARHVGVDRCDANRRVWAGRSRRSTPRPGKPTKLATDPRLADYPYLPATRADLLRRLGDAAGAAQSYRRARNLTANAAERAFLEQRLAEVSRAAGAEPAPG